MPYGGDRLKFVGITPPNGILCGSRAAYLPETGSYLEPDRHNYLNRTSYPDLAPHISLAKQVMRLTLQNFYP